MLSIRLMRTGKAHSPHYRIVVQEKRSKITGKSVDQIGHYHPADKDKKVVIDADKARAWMAKGAQPSDTVNNLFVKQGILDKSVTVHHFYTPTPKAAEEVKTENEETVEEVVEMIEDAPVAEATEEATETTEEEAA
jgi:small subunit ribosomal protein S16